MLSFALLGVVLTGAFRGVTESIFPYSLCTEKHGIFYSEDLVLFTASDA